MWKIVSDPKYVADPAKGSIHNRGGAVDLTLVDKNGKELDMGTPFDFFGPQASHDFKDLPANVKRNRRFLSRVMQRHGFERFDSEWWHYNLNGARQFPVANQNWPCE
jgi:D-alanyl-D-alanine dipeptidase